MYIVWVFNLLHPLPVDFRANNVTSGSLPVTWVTWRHFLSCDCLLLRATALWEVKCTVYMSYWPSTATCRWLPVKWHHFRLTCGDLRSLMSFPIRWLLPRASYSLVGSEMYSVRVSLPIYSHFQVTSGQFVTAGHLTSRDIISCHVTASCCELLPFKNWNIQYMRVLGLLQQFQETSIQMT